MSKGRGWDRVGVVQKLTKTKDIGKATLQANVKTLNWRKVCGQRSPVWEDNADSKIYRQ